MGESGATEAGDMAAARARLDEVRERIAAAAARAGRQAGEITLVAVSKRHPDAAVRALAAAGQEDFGENLVQPWRARLETLRDLAGIRWHLIGPIQTNKAKYVAAGRPVLLHTVDRSAVVEALDSRLEATAPQDCLIQVNIDDELSKSGCAPEELDVLADVVAGTPSLRLVGLMCIPKPRRSGPPRKAFARLRQLTERVADRYETGATPILSMGMSDDFEAAIEEGSTLVRIGTALFGPRPT